MRNLMGMKPTLLGCWPLKAFPGQGEPTHCSSWHPALSPSMHPQGRVLVQWLPTVQNRWVRPKLLTMATGPAPVNSSLTSLQPHWAYGSCCPLCPSARPPFKVTSWEQARVLILTPIPVISILVPCFILPVSFFTILHYFVLPIHCLSLPPEHNLH